MQPCLLAQICSSPVKGDHASSSQGYITAYLSHSSLNWPACTRCEVTPVLKWVSRPLRKLTPSQKDFWHQSKAYYELLLKCWATWGRQHTEYQASQRERWKTDTCLWLCKNEHKVRLSALKSLVQAKVLHCKQMAWRILVFVLLDTKVGCRKFPRWIRL